MVNVDRNTGSNDTFRVYYTPPIPPLDDEDESGGGNGVVFVCVHGAGYSGLSWAAFAQQVTAQSKGKNGVLSYDARSHGETTSPSCRSLLAPALTVPDTPRRPAPLAGKTTVDGDRQGAPDLSLETLSADLVALLKAMFPVREQAPAFVLVGHSMVSRSRACICRHRKSGR